MLNNKIIIITVINDFTYRTDETIEKRRLHRRFDGLRHRNFLILKQNSISVNCSGKNRPSSSELQMLTQLNSNTDVTLPLKLRESNAQYSVPESGHEIPFKNDFCDSFNCFDCIFMRY